MVVWGIVVGGICGTVKSGPVDKPGGVKSGIEGSSAARAVLSPQKLKRIDRAYLMSPSSIWKKPSALEAVVQYRYMTPGRPLKCDAKIFLERVADLLRHTRADGCSPPKAGLLLHLGISRETWRECKERPEFVDTMGTHIACYHVHVIGNIYENPDLLK